MLEHGGTSVRYPPPPSTTADARTVGLELTVRQLTDRDVVEVRGELDVATAPALGKCLLRLTAELVEVDLRHLWFVDCAGIAVLLAAARLFGARSALLLRSPRPAAERLFFLLDVETQLRIEP